MFSCPFSHCNRPDKYSSATSFQSGKVELSKMNLPVDAEKHLAEYKKLTLNAN